MDNKVDISVHIRKNDIGEVRVYEDWVYEGDDGLPDLYIWEEGNYSCDCNRRLFFARVNKEEEDWESGCGDGEYSVKILLGDKCIYAEGEWNR